MALGMVVLLVGTNHAHQLSGYRDGAAETLNTYLKGIVDTEAIDLLAEELNEEAVKRFRASDSTARLVALERKLAHIFCDPNTSERRALGIPTVEELLDKLGYGCNPSDEEKANLEIETRRYWPIRENFWLKKLSSCSSNRCLFVLGSNHVQSFSLLLSEHGIQNQVKVGRWEP